MSDPARLPPHASGGAPSTELLERLHAWCRLSERPPAAPTLAQTLRRPVQRLLSRLLRRQEAFNTTVVEYLDTVVRPLERELRASLGALQSDVQNLSRELARRPALPGAASAPPEPGAASPPASPAAIPAVALGRTYLGFENEFRGSVESIRDAQAEYVPLFAGAADVLDIGCGRGEFLALLREARIPARGVDVNDAMVDVCRARGLDAAAADALGHLRAQPDGSLGGLFAAQVVEHLEPAYLGALLQTAFDKLRPGAPIVLETINPACWIAFFESYIRDITHVRPLHPDTLGFLLLAAGFQRLDIRYRAPYPDGLKLQPVPSTAARRDAVRVLNANVERLNGLLFTHQDYAAIAWRPVTGPAAEEGPVISR